MNEVLVKFKVKGTENICELDVLRAYTGQKTYAGAVRVAADSYCSLRDELNELKKEFEQLSKKHADVTEALKTIKEL